MDIAKVLLILGGKAARIILAWLIGSVIYFILAIATTYDGFGSMICQPFMAMGISAFVVFIALVAGLPFLLLKNHLPTWLKYSISLCSAFAGVVFLIIPPVFMEINPSNQEPISNTAAWMVIAGYFLILFTIVHFPQFYIVRPKKEDA